ncbi:hypothetical protein GCM10022226_74000 [Sphaerisporangium flaviroseum]|uniref:Uncharacterized protein n=1 Tax=Sphaerisporangium flaviroseum TaxID=509199 RepID=A0ABP7JCU7_9ACTN
MTPPLPAEFLTKHAAVRTRTVDDHMFAVDQIGHPPATFRLQLFTAPGAQPVAVVTQEEDEGQSLSNAAEQYAAEVWRRHCAESAQPPIWIEHQLLPDKQWEQMLVVVFTTTGPFQLKEPDWKAITELQVAELVGAPVDPGRGEGYRPRPPKPKPQKFYRVRWVAAFPGPKPYRAECMPDLTGWQRLARQLRPRPPARQCCWYHGGDWRRVCSTAIRLVRRAERAGVPYEDIRQAVLDDARTEGMSEWELDALNTLLADPIVLGHTGRWPAFAHASYANGQHRSQAMLEAGVRRTITLDWRSP